MASSSKCHNSPGFLEKLAIPVSPMYKDCNKISPSFLTDKLKEVVNSEYSDGKSIVSISNTMKEKGYNLNHDEVIFECFEGESEEFESRENMIKVMNVSNSMKWKVKQDVTLRDRAANILNYLLFPILFVSFFVISTLMTIPLFLFSLTRFLDELVFIIFTGLVTFYQIPKIPFYVYMCFLFSLSYKKWLSLPASDKTKLAFLKISKIVLGERRYSLLMKFKSFRLCNPFNYKYCKTDRVVVVQGSHFPEITRAELFNDVQFVRVKKRVINYNEGQIEVFTQFGLTIFRSNFYGETVDYSYEMNDVDYSRSVKYLSSVALNENCVLVGSFKGNTCHAYTLKESLDIIINGNSLMFVDLVNKVEVLGLELTVYENLKPLVNYLYKKYGKDDSDVLMHHNYLFCKNELCLDMLFEVLKGNTMISKEFGNTKWKLYRSDVKKIIERRKIKAKIYMVINYQLSKSALESLKGIELKFIYKKIPLSDNFENECRGKIRSSIINSIKIIDMGFYLKQAKTLSSFNVKVGKNVETKDFEEKPNDSAEIESHKDPEDEENEEKNRLKEFNESLENKIKYKEEKILSLRKRYLEKKTETESYNLKKLIEGQRRPNLNQMEINEMSGYLMCLRNKQVARGSVINIKSLKPYKIVMLIDDQLKRTEAEIDTLSGLLDKSVTRFERLFKETVLIENEKKRGEGNEIKSPFDLVNKAIPGFDEIVKGEIKILVNKHKLDSYSRVFDIGKTKRGKRDKGRKLGNIPEIVSNFSALELTFKNRRCSINKKIIGLRNKTFNVRRSQLNYKINKLKEGLIRKIKIRIEELITVKYLNDMENYISKCENSGQGQLDKMKKEEEKDMEILERLERSLENNFLGIEVMMDIFKGKHIFPKC